MKRIFVLMLSCAITFFSISAQAQMGKVSAKVTNAFKMKYPEARNVEWKDNIGGIQANFEMKGGRCEASYTKNGRWLKTEMKMSENDLPKAVRNGLMRTKYKSWNILSANVTYYSDGKTHYHIVAAKNDLRKKELVFSTRGQLLSDNVTI